MAAQVTKQTRLLKEKRGGFSCTAWYEESSKKYLVNDGVEPKSSSHVVGRDRGKTRRAASPIFNQSLKLVTALFRSFPSSPARQDGLC